MLPCYHLNKSANSEFLLRYKKCNPDWLRCNDNFQTEPRYGLYKECDCVRAKQKVHETYDLRLLQHPARIRSLQEARLREMTLWVCIY